MNVVERTQTAITGEGLPDRVPIHAWLGLQFIRTFVPRHQSIRDLFQLWIDDPVGTLVKYQEDLGLDPVITTYSRHIGEHEMWSRMLFPYAEDSRERWDETILEVDRTATSRTLSVNIRTPAGDGQYIYQIEGYVSWLVEHLIKDERDLELLAYRPDPKHLDLRIFNDMITKVGDRAFWLHHPTGPWHEAVELRGFVPLSYDIYDRPKFVHRLMRIVTDRLIKLYRRLSETDIHAISMNETWVGAGISADIYREFIYPYEVECVAAAHDAGLLVSYHNCGKGSEFLEDMIATGPDAFETITASRNRGDFDLLDVKRRLQNRVCFDRRI